MRVLVVAMSGSVHTARWLSQLQGLGWDLHLFSSWETDIHPDLRELTIHGGRLPFRHARVPPTVRLAGRMWPIPGDRLYGKYHRLFPPRRAESELLAKLIEKLRPDVIHSLEIQHSGYLTYDARSRIQGAFPPWIVTNWGSDISYFSTEPAHREKIKTVLSSCDFYSCECERDIAPARSLGFRGGCLPVAPNTGGFRLDQVTQHRAPGPTSARRVIAVKGHQGWAGRALTALQAIERSADVVRDYSIRVYSAAEEVAQFVAHLSRSGKLRIEILPKVSHSEMLRLHGSARVSLGVSITDGVSTSFLEALVMGSFPIQTETACCDEWIKHGETGLIVKPDDVEGIALAVQRAVQDDALVDHAAEANWQTTIARLDFWRLRELAIEMYRTAAKKVA